MIRSHDDMNAAASNIYPAKDSPQYLSGNVISGSLCLTATVGALLMTLLLHLENKRRDKRYGKPEATLAIDMAGDADKHHDFRYVL